jgi:hypothetical protein
VDKKMNLSLKIYIKLMRINFEKVNGARTSARTSASASARIKSKIIINSVNAPLELDSAIIRNDVSAVRMIVFSGLVTVNHKHVYLADTMRDLCGSDYTIVDFLNKEYHPPPHIPILAQLFSIDVDFSDTL